MDGYIYIEGSWSMDHSVDQSLVYARSIPGRGVTWTSIDTVRPSVRTFLIPKSEFTGL